MSNDRSFISLLEQRLAKGAKDYGYAERPGGDPRSIHQLIGELQQELVDVAGWGKLSFDKLEAMRLEVLKAQAANPCEQANRDVEMGRIKDVLKQVTKQRDQLQQELAEARGMLKFWNDSYDGMRAKVAALEGELANCKSMLRQADQKALAAEADAKRMRDILAGVNSILGSGPTLIWGGHSAVDGVRALSDEVKRLLSVVASQDAKLAAIKADTKQWLEKL